jgi:hypothetical protein
VEVKRMQRMQQRSGARAAVGIAVGLGLWLAAPAALAEIYAWRTDDGGYAYTDDRDQVPARYASQVKVLPGGQLADYARFTRQDTQASDRYAARLSERLAHLRAVNAPELATASPHAVGVGAQQTVSLATGDVRAPEIQLPVAAGAGPIVVEPVTSKRSGDIRTHRVTVVRQGDETLAVIKSHRQITNVNEFEDDDDLAAGLPLED